MSTLGGGPVNTEYANVGGVDLPSEYKCTKFYEDNPDDIEEYVQEYYYDLVYAASEEVESAIGLVETKLLDQVANQYGVSTGVSCVRPELDSLWAVSVSSQPTDMPNTAIDDRASCIELSADSDQQVCKTIAGKIGLGVVGAADEDELVQFIKAAMNSGAVTDDTTSQVKFLGSVLDDSVYGGKEVLPNAINSAEEPVQPKDDKVTPEGVIFVMGLVAAFVGLVVVVTWRVRRRRRHDKAVAVGEALDHAEKGAGANGKGDDDELGTTLTHSFDNPEDLPPIPQDFDSTYSFEMGDLQKLEMLGLHGGGVVTGKGVEPGAEAATGGEVSDSDVDSWAQTDASLGSIELRLEPITAEV